MIATHDPDEPAYDPATRAGDYRTSHLHKGEDYDRDLAGDAFQAYVTEQEYIVLDRLVDALFPDGVPRYLDFACGTGRVTQRLEGRCAEPYGVDISESMVEQARHKCPRTHFVVADVTRDRLDLAPVDLVTSFRFFGNAQDELRRGALGAIHDLLRPGGYLVINNHRNAGALQQRLLRLRGEGEPLDLDYPSLARMLRESGLRVRHSHGLALWAVRHRWRQPDVVHGRTVRLIEPLSRRLARLCPDYVLVAQRDV
jgi:SAM-dependent methyltransferase